MPTKISWTDESWNTVSGCSPVSGGCRNCYSMAMTRRLQAMGSKKYAKGFDTVVCHDDPKLLGQPSRWKRPRRIFVNSMSDLFHEDVPFSFIDKVFDIMWENPKHTFQILSKRVERMVDYLLARQRRGFGWTDIERTPMNPGSYSHIETMYYRDECGYRYENKDLIEQPYWACEHPRNEDRYERGSCDRCGCPIAENVDTRRQIEEIGILDDYDDFVRCNGDDVGPYDKQLPDDFLEGGTEWMQLHTRPWGAMCSNVAIGFTAETQALFRERAKLFRRLRDRNPYQTLFCSIEPMLGDWDIADITSWHRDPFGVQKFYDGGHETQRHFLDWIIVGGESGKGSRPLGLKSAEDLVRRARYAGCKVFFKQMGTVWAKENGSKSRKGAILSEWPEWAQVQELPEP